VTSNPGTPSTPSAQIATRISIESHPLSNGHVISVQLEPAELGKVQVQIDRLQNAPHVKITVQRPETMAALMHDSSQLQRALDQAGVASQGRSITLLLGSPNSGHQGGQMKGEAQTALDLGGERSNHRRSDAREEQSGSPAQPTAPMADLVPGMPVGSLDITT
jgi:flagellar hook-length control protein FliK